jgi:prevent-host-death family protein
MPKIVNLHAAKTHLSRLVDEAAAGQEIVIAKAGTPVARLVMFRKQGKPRKPGLLKGQIRIAKDFDAPLPAEVMKLFEGE